MLIPLDFPLTGGNRCRNLLSSKTFRPSPGSALSSANPLENPEFLSWMILIVGAGGPLFYWEMYFYLSKTPTSLAFNPPNSRSTS
ncbi:unnamed protein product [Allacma fusca]|uniref:Uncharacterized protein n=1 Tax=Allacma fusca TaxID=39272 RepID=A0A8J2K5H4_9HEXA|nr:unnamed protein product [Allacma fusca]